MSRWAGDMEELDELFPDPDDRRMAAILTSVQAPEVTADPAFRSQLRRQVMQEAWGRGERRRREAGGSFWRGLFAPKGLAWAGAMAGVLMVAVGAYGLSRGVGGDNIVYVRYNVDPGRPVASVQPIEVTFSQPMDHPSTEKAVQITPATLVSYDWAGNTLKITPTNGSFAPNTQYTVNIQPNVAQTASGTAVPAVKPAVFTVAPTPTPVPTPTPTPTATPAPPADVTGEKQLATAAARGATWSPDGTTVYFRGGDKLQSVAASGGDSKTVVASGVELFALSADGKLVIYSGPAGVGTVATDGTHPVEVAKIAARAVGWAGSKPLYATSTSVFAGSELKLANPLAAGQVEGWFSPDGAYFLHATGKTLHALELATGKEADWTSDASFLAWSPDSKRVLFDAAGGQFAADPAGQSPVKLGAVVNVVGATWTQPALAVLDGQQSFWAENADGSGSKKLAAGDFGSPVLAPSGSSVAFLRAGGLWVGQVAVLANQAGPSPDKGAALIADFMKARVDGKADVAQGFLDANAKRDFSTPNGPQLLRTTSPKLSRSFTVLTGVSEASAKFTVRLVLADASGKDLSQLDESLALVADASGKPLVDHAVDGTAFAYGPGPAVLAVTREGGAYKVSFDSDLTPATAAAGIQLVDPAAKAVPVTPTVRGRDVLLPVTSTGALKLVVLPALKDKDGHGAAAEYDLDLAALGT
jgi:hypothetical protein